jgi:type IV pilus assembly protein PilQ
VVMVAPTQEIASREELELASQQKIEELAPLRSEFLQVNYAKAADLAALLKSAENRLLSERGQVTVDERTNTLLIQDTAAKLEDIRRMVLRLDVPVRQVMIESRIVIANNDFARDLGVRFGWSGSRDLGSGNQVNIGGGLAGHLDGTYGANKGPFLQDTAGNAFNSGYALPNGGTAEALLVDLPANAPSGAINFLIGKIGSYLLQLELSAMQQEGRGEVISSPRVITSDQKQARIKQGVEIPFQERTSSGATSVAFKEAVLSLEVTPRITPDDRIDMELKVNKDSPDFAREVLGVPPVDTREVETTVLVDNGETVVLGGVYERTKTMSKEQVPLLGDIPVLGYLFKQKDETDNNSELLIFITPKILKETLSSR